MYTTLEQLRTRYGSAEIAQKTETASEASVPSPRLAQWIADANAEIDLALRKRYSVPLAVVPAEIEEIASSLVRIRYFLPHAPESVETEALSARQRLARLADGTASLDIPERTPRARVHSFAGKRLLTGSALRDW